jgi:hypothetical protein
MSCDRKAEIRSTKIEEDDGMAARFNHTIVWSSDQTMSARFLAEMLGRPAPTRFGDFDVLELDNGVSLDFADAEGPIRPQHYAFLISEAEFDAVLSRIRERGLEHWADPMRHRPGEINHNYGGRGVYFPDPDGHYLEVITRPSGGASTEPSRSRRRRRE